MKKRIIALSLAIPLLLFALSACFTEPETKNPNESQGGLSATGHYNDLMRYLSKSQYLFFDKTGDRSAYNIEIEKDNNEIEGTLKADLLENKYAFDFDIDFTADGEEQKELEFLLTYGDGNIYSSANGISTLPLKTSHDGYGLQTEALRALYGIRSLTYSAFTNDIEKYYHIVETDDKEATVASFSINGEDIKKHAEESIFDEKYGFDAESLELDCDISLKTLPEGEGVKVTDFQVDSSLLYVANERLCEFVIHYNESSFDAVFKVYSDSEKKEINSEYSLKAKDGKGTLLLSGELREMNTEDYMYAPESFKCHTLEVPFEYNEADSIDLNGYILTIERIRFKGEAVELQSNTATNAENEDFVFGKDIDLTLSFVHFAKSGEFRVKGISDGFDFEITRGSSRFDEIAIPTEYTESKDEFIAELYENAPEFCERFGIMQESADPEGIIEASDGYGSYIIDLSQKNGYFTTSFTMIPEGIKFTDGRVLPLSYESLIHDDENDVRTATINGRNYLLSSYTDYEGTLCQSLECTDEIEGYAVTSKVLFYPELEYGDITMGFTVEVNGDKYTLTYLDGYKEEKTITFDSEIGMYIIE